MAHASTLVLIRAHEGTVPYAYDDKDPSNPKKRLCALTGKLTCGTGFNIQDRNIPQAVIDFWLAYLIDNECVPALNMMFPEFGNFSQNRQDALIDMIYNLGQFKFGQFLNMISAIRKNDWATASIEALNSSWAVQVPARAKNIALMLKNG